MSNKDWRTRLSRIYKNSEIAGVAQRLIEEKLNAREISKDIKKSFSEEDVMLITYGDSIINGDEQPLRTLKRFLADFVNDSIPYVHLLPMYPYTSDDGFSVVDYRKIDPLLGNWEDIKDLAANYGLMFDAVINHISQKSDWFEKFKKGHKPYDNYFIIGNPNADYSKVVRPRVLPLLTEVETERGKVCVWTTFSEDQIDLNYETPEVLAEMIDLLLFYAEQGAKYIRLDAIGFMWKELGTTCMHLPQTHEIIKLMKEILNIYAPMTRLITETNVPHEDNVSYFGNGKDEADLVYQFPLPPLVMHSFLSGSAKKIREWLKTLTLPSSEVTFFNFLSSHDGIGMRPAEGLLTKKERDFLVEATLRSGGRVSYKDNGDGTKSPYELNINYQDALSAPDESDELRIKKFIAAETILLSLQGVPGIYIHSLLGSRNDYYGMTTTDIPRRINREKLDFNKITDQLKADTNRAKIFRELIRRLNIRKKEKAFAPSASQKVLEVDQRVLAVKRGDEKEGAIICLINVSGEEVMIKDLKMKGDDLLTDQEIGHEVVLLPYQSMWIKYNN